jgi:hypothetical protein
MKFAIQTAVLVILLAVAGLTLTANTGTSAGADCNEGAKTSGRLAPGGAAQVDLKFCSDPSDGLSGWVSWGNKIRADTNLAVVVVSPDGTRFGFDDPYPQATQPFYLSGPLQEGDWKILVFNTSSSRVSYSIDVAFG